MLELGFPPDARRGIDGGEPLHTAAYLGRADVLRLLLEQGADLVHRDGSREARLATAEVLLEAGARHLLESRVGQEQAPGYCIVEPPLTPRTCPVMKRASSDAR